MNGFEMHGIKHSSISQINKWIGCPSAWVSHYLFNNKSGASPAMWRGIFYGTSGSRHDHRQDAD